jgi:hypothetical protein
MATKLNQAAAYATPHTFGGALLIVHRQAHAIEQDISSLAASLGDRRVTEEEIATLLHPLSALLQQYEHSPHFCRCN